MTYEILWTDQALAAAQAYMDDDPEGLARAFDVVDLLAHDPRPEGAFRWGTDRYRLHIGRYRVIYEIAEKTVTVAVIHLGRTSTR